MLVNYLTSKGKNSILNNKKMDNFRSALIKGRSNLTKGINYNHNTNKIKFKNIFL